MNNALAPQNTDTKYELRSRSGLLLHTYDTHRAALRGVTPHNGRFVVATNTAPESFSYMGGASDYDTINGVPCVEIALHTGHRVWFKEADTLNNDGNVYVQEFAQKVR